MDRIIYNCIIVMGGSKNTTSMTDPYVWVQDYTFVSSPRREKSLCQYVDAPRSGAYWGRWASQHVRVHHVDLHLESVQ